MRKNLREVFDICKSKGMTINLNDSCCSSPDTQENIENEHSSRNMCATVLAVDRTDDRIFEEIEEEGSAVVSWTFRAQHCPRALVGNMLAEIFRESGYIVEWNENMPNKITTVVEESDLPPNLYHTLSTEGEDESIMCISDVEYDMDNEVHEEASSKDDASTTKMSCPSCGVMNESNDLDDQTECDNDCGTYECSSCQKEWYFSGNVETKGHNPHCGEEDNARVDPEDDVIFTKDDEQDMIYDESDEESDEESDYDENICDEPVIDPDSDLEDDEDNDLSDLACDPDCECVNCVAEREDD